MFTVDLINNPFNNSVYVAVSDNMILITDLEIWAWKLRFHSTKQWDDQRITDLKRYGRKRYGLGIYLDELRKTTKPLSQES
jgi:hypothetical protein